MPQNRTVLTPLSFRVMIGCFIVFLSSPAEGASDKASKIRSIASNPAITLYSENEFGVPIFVRGILSDPTSKGSEVSTVLNFLDENRAVYKFADPRQELVTNRVDIDRQGLTHIRMDRYHRGIRVYGAQLTAHFDRFDRLHTVAGKFLANIDIDVTPTISGLQASETAIDDLSSYPADKFGEESELIIFEWQGINYLAWRVVVSSRDALGRWEYFIDARSSEVILFLSLVMSDNDIGTGFSVLGFPRNHIDTDFNGSSFGMFDDTRLTSNNPHGHGGQMAPGEFIQTLDARTTFPGPILTDADNVWDDTDIQTAAVDAHVYAALFYDWMLAQLGRNSYDDLGSSMISSVKYFDTFNNAFWNGSQVTYLKWSGSWRSLSGCPDVVGHEFGHGVTGWTSGLVYAWESGALSESFSDMIGTAFEFAIDSLEVPDWWIAENCQVSGNGFRSMEDPTIFGDPDTYEGAGWVNVNGCTPSSGNDQCGVHTNSGVGNKWFYLLSEGGIHNGVSVTGIGVENAIKVAYHSNAYYWTSNSTYSEAALGTISGADDLDTNFLWSISVAEAWNAVGIPIQNPALAFGADSTFGWAPMNVNFSASSVFSVSGWTWDFGDGNGSTMQSPSHNYTNPGWYDVGLAIDTGGGGRTLVRPTYIAVLADSLIAVDVQGIAGDSVVVEIYARNTVPLQQITVPVAITGDLDIQYLSHTTVGSRTDYFESATLVNFDLFNNRFAIKLVSSTSGAQPDLPPGTGPILKIVFGVSPTATNTEVANLDISGYSSHSPTFAGDVGVYDARAVTGQIMLCSQRGDMDGNLNIDIADLTYLVSFMFGGGPAPNPLLMANVDCIGAIDIADLTYLVQFMFGGGPAPCGC